MCLCDTVYIVACNYRRRRVNDVLRMLGIFAQLKRLLGPNQRTLVVVVLEIWLLTQVDPQVLQITRRNDRGTRWVKQMWIRQVGVERVLKDRMIYDLG